ncbi:MAG: formate dehydrogenase accessory protein FdhE [Dehalococcoidaceae bacterium]|nr:formate dehydrogenase accessory protein FdhE [Dehalococcoidaceae bacterium]
MYKPEVNDTTTKILKGLEEWAGESAHSSRFFDFYLKLLQIQAEAEERSGIPATGLGHEELNRRILDGTTLIKMHETDIDWNYASSIFNQLANLFGDYSDILPGFTSISDVALPAITAEIAQSWLEGNIIPSDTEKTVLEPQALATLMHHTLRPFLTGYGLAFKERFNQHSWRRGHCPVCGSVPSFSYLDKEKGARYLVCSCCNTDWLFQRLDCPFCHNVEQPLLSYRTDESGLYRVYFCEKCKHYLKAVDLRKVAEDINLGLEMIITADLDRQAQELGYTSAENRLLEDPSSEL